MIYALIPLGALVLAVAICIYINPGPRVTQNAKSKWLVTVPIAHRGLHDNEAGVPENSLLACKRAVEQGYGIELDVQLTSDGRVVVFHDYNLKRMTGMDQKVTEMSWEQLKDLKLLGTDQGIPLLADFLTLVQGKAPLLIEVKNEGSVGALEQAVLDELHSYSGEFAIQSFNPFVVQYFSLHAPEIIRGQLSSTFKGENLAWWKKFLLSNLLLNFLSKPAFIAYDFGKLPKWFANRLRQKGLYLLTWTVKNPEDYARALELFDNAIFEGFTAPKTQVYGGKKNQ